MARKSTDPLQVLISDSKDIKTLLHSMCHFFKESNVHRGCAIDENMYRVLKAENAQLKAEVEDLKARLNAMESVTRTNSHCLSEALHLLSGTVDQTRENENSSSSKNKKQMMSQQCILIPLPMETPGPNSESSPRSNSLRNDNLICVEQLPPSPPPSCTSRTALSSFYSSFLNESNHQNQSIASQSEDNEETHFSKPKAHEPKSVLHDHDYNEPDETIPSIVYRPFPGRTVYGDGRGYFFSTKLVRGDKRYLKCVELRNGKYCCNSSGIMSTNIPNAPIRCQRPHNHPPYSRNIDATSEFRSTLRKRAETELDVPPKTIAEETLKQFPKASQYYSVKAATRVVGQQRRAKLRRIDRQMIENATVDDLESCLKLSDKPQTHRLVEVPEEESESESPNSGFIDEVVEIINVEPKEDALPMPAAQPKKAVPTILKTSNSLPKLDLLESSQPEPSVEVVWDDGLLLSPPAKPKKTPRKTSHSTLRLDTVEPINPKPQSVQVVWNDGLLLPEFMDVDDLI